MQKSVAHTSDHRPLTTGAAGRLVGRSAETIRNWAKSGRLPFERTESGIRLYNADDVRAAARATAGIGAKG